MNIDELLDELKYIIDEDTGLATHLIMEKFRKPIQNFINNNYNKKATWEDIKRKIIN